MVGRTGYFNLAVMTCASFFLCEWLILQVEKGIWMTPVLHARLKSYVSWCTLKFPMISPVVCRFLVVCASSDGIRATPATQHQPGHGASVAAPIMAGERFASAPWWQDDASHSCKAFSYVQIRSGVYLLEFCYPGAGTPVSFCKQIWCVLGKGKAAWSIY